MKTPSREVRKHLTSPSKFGPNNADLLEDLHNRP